MKIMHQFHWGNKSNTWCALKKTLITDKLNTEVQNPLIYQISDSNYPSRFYFLNSGKIKKVIFFFVNETKMGLIGY